VNEVGLSPAASVVGERANPPRVPASDQKG